jgi:sec-independent protein translocase protein TatA
MGPIGIPELVIILVILLVIFGPKRLPGIGKSLGTGMREFKDSISGEGKRDDEDDDRPALRAAPADPAPSTLKAEREDEARVPETRS